MTDCVSFDSIFLSQVSIRGQAFGVGALEEDDDDIYATEGMAHYDFALGPEPSAEPSRAKARERTVSTTLRSLCTYTYCVLNYLCSAIPVTKLRSHEGKHNFHPCFASM